MELPPPLGYRVEGLPIAGLQRRMEWRILLPFKVVRSVAKARSVVRNFKADVVGIWRLRLGSGFVDGSENGHTYNNSEQNSYAGVTNRIVGRGASASGRL